MPHSSSELAASPVAIAGATFADLTLGDVDQPYRIFLYRPARPAPPEGWPVLYLTDGNACFATAVDAQKVQMSYPSGTNICDGVIVAIGYPSDEAYDPVRRSWDLSPPPGRTYPPFFPDTPDVRTGGGADFLSAIEDELKSWVEKQVPIDRSRQSLFGHSFGGLFVLHALFTRPRAFRRWIAASPAIFWEDAAILVTERAFLERADVPPGLELHLSAGQYESERCIAPFHKGRPDEGQRLARALETRIVEYARAMAERWEALPALAGVGRFEEYAGENHMSVLPVAVNRAVQIAFRQEM
ncbi:ferri-bacillibactin esterase BesA [Sinorhizobium sp. KGO-5]|uniref:alpha/beta hydrolase n=1 Tax=Sinorhizobium sp. KGO-5 TaxID=1470810 RepID=UPI002949C9AE|nr:ferri-bacillibactin esterase BesA [Sinorhizobium sp. KGO-5]